MGNFLQEKKKPTKGKHKTQYETQKNQQKTKTISDINPLKLEKIFIHLGLWNNMILVSKSVGQNLCLMDKS